MFSGICYNLYLDCDLYLILDLSECINNINVISNIDNVLMCFPLLSNRTSSNTMPYYQNVRCSHNTSKYKNTHIHTTIQRYNYPYLVESYLFIIITTFVIIPTLLLIFTLNDSNCGIEALYLFRFDDISSLSDSIIPEIDNQEDATSYPCVNYNGRACDLLSVFNYVKIDSNSSNEDNLYMQQEAYDYDSVLNNQFISFLTLYFSIIITLIAIETWLFRGKILTSTLIRILSKNNQLKEVIIYILGPIIGYQVINIMEIIADYDRSLSILSEGDSIKGFLIKFEIGRAHV